ncbi:MAG: hypothetical protein LBQ47_00705 [Endomicrobium sp.]|nr:hypothetical protein [Endomicrobium sp.]
MLKKTAVVLCGLLMLGSISYAGENKHEGKVSKEERKAKIEAMKKDRIEFDKNIDALIEKYNKADKKDQDAVKQEITALVSAQTDKNIIRKKEMLEEQRARIEKLEKKIADIETNREKYISDKVDSYISKEGQDKREKAKKSKHKKDKKDKKDKKKKFHSKEDMDDNFEKDKTY